MQGISQMSWTEGCQWGGMAGTQVLPELTGLELTAEATTIQAPNTPHLLSQTVLLCGLGGVGALTESSWRCSARLLVSKRLRDTPGGTQGAENSGYSDVGGPEICAFRALKSISVSVELPRWNGL